jgi:hypothetical protein
MAILSNAQIMVLDKDLAPFHNMDPVRAYFNAFAAGDTVVCPVQPIFCYRVPES